MKRRDNRQGDLFALAPAAEIMTPASALALPRDPKQPTILDWLAENPKVEAPSRT